MAAHGEAVCLWIQLCLYALVKSTVVQLTSLLDTVEAERYFKAQVHISISLTNYITYYRLRKDINWIWASLHLLNFI